MAAERPASDNPADVLAWLLEQYDGLVIPLDHDEGTYKVLRPLVHGGSRISRCTVHGFIPDEWCYNLPWTSLIGAWAAWDGTGSPHPEWSRRMAAFGSVYPSGELDIGSGVRYPIEGDPATYQPESDL